MARLTRRNRENYNIFIPIMHGWISKDPPPPPLTRGGGVSLELREIFSSILREFQIFLKKILRNFWSSLREFLRDFQIFLKPKRISNLSLRETFVFLLETNLKSFFSLREFQIFLKPKRISNLSLRETFFLS